MTDTLTALRADYEALGKRIAELEKEQKPCPLEVGKPVRIKITEDLIRNWNRERDESFSVDAELTYNNAEPSFSIKVSDWGDYTLERARQLAKVGGSSD